MVLQALTGRLVVLVSVRLLASYFPRCEGNHPVAFSDTLDLLLTLKPKTLSASTS